MMKITEHITTEEITCKCGCGFDKLDIKTAKAFEKIREVIGSPLHINSGCRCKQYNAKIGGAKNSQHVKGTALDIKTPENIDYDVFYRICDSVIGNIGGVGYYSSGSFVHIDTRGHRARWRR